MADSSKAILAGRGRFELAEGFDGCLVGIRQSLFRNQTLLVYDKQRHSFTDRLTVAEFFVGDSGNMELTGSWLFDYDGDSDKDLMRWEIIEQRTKMDKQGRPIETNAVHISLLLWDAGRFEASPSADTAALVKLCPLL